MVSSGIAGRRVFWNIFQKMKPRSIADNEGHPTNEISGHYVLKTFQIEASTQTIQNSLSKIPDSVP